VLATGWFLSLALLFATPLWNWELSEQPPIGPALSLANRKPGESIQLLAGDQQTQRPSLNWYLDSATPPLAREGGRWPRTSFRLLARTDLGTQGAAARCQLEESGEEGWKRWACGPRKAGS
jgi:hypothetical protein